MKTYQCSKCGIKHERPVGKKCKLKTNTSAASGLSQDSHVSATMSHNVTDEQITSRTSTPVGATSIEPSINEKLDMIATALNAIQQNQNKLAERIDKLEQSPDRSKRVSETSVWDTLSRTITGDNGCSPTLPKPPQNPVHRPQMIPTLHADLNAHAATTKRIEELETLAKEQFLVNGGKLPISKPIISNSVINQGTLTKKIVKSGRDRTGGDDNCRIYVPWPQEHCYVGPNRVRVRYDELTQAQFSTGLLNIIESENDECTRKNMTKLVASMHQDICDYSYIPVRGALAVCLSAIEDGRASWKDYDTLFNLKKQYLLTSESRSSNYVNSSSSRSPRGNNQSTGHSSQNQNQVRLCRNFNNGKCAQSHGHTHSGISYSHYCAFCIKQGSFFPHSEQNCKKRAKMNDNGNA